MRAWFAPAAAEELLHFRSLVEQVGSADVLRVVLARSARSARRTAHFDLEFPREPQLEPYWCFKHRRECKPVEAARRFLLRYTLDTLERIEAFAAVRADGCVARMLHGDARAIDLEGPYDGVITSPPYPGLIDYHEQHRYAYELLGVDERRDLELGRPARRNGPGGDRGVRRRRRTRARERALVARARRADVHRRQRPPRPLSRDPASGPGSASSTVTSAT